MATWPAPAQIGQHLLGAGSELWVWWLGSGGVGQGSGTRERRESSKFWYLVFAGRAFAIAGQNGMILAVNCTF